MIHSLVTALVTYLATSVDEIPVLFLLYSRSDHRGKAKTITAGYFIGTGLLIFAGLAGALGVGQIPKTWIIGLFGLVPLLMGIKMLLFGEEEDEEEKAFGLAKKQKTLLMQVVVITLGLGADDIGVYLPVFSTLSAGELVSWIVVFALCTAGMCIISYKMTHLGKWADFIENYERYLVGIVFIVLGVLILFECGTIEKVTGWLQALL